jgi:hypothetical protein
MSLAAWAPVIGEALGLIDDLVQAGKDPAAEIAKLRELYGEAKAAAVTGATPETEDAWERAVREKFGRGGSP